MSALPRAMRRLNRARGPRALVALWAFALAAPAFALSELPEGAVGSAIEQDGEPSVEARLLVDAEVVGVGERIRVGVLFTLAPGWHIYWKNPGESGFATNLAWQASGARLGDTRWPAPRVFREAEGTLTSYGYEDSVLLTHLAQVTAAQNKSVALFVDADFVACKIECIPGRISLQRLLRVSSLTHPADTETRELFDHWAEKVPVSAHELGLIVDVVVSQSAIRPGDDVRAALSFVCEGAAPLCRGLRAEPDDAFIPDVIPALRIDVTGTRPHPFADGLLVTLAARAGAESPPEDWRLRGVARLRSADGRVLRTTIDEPLPQAPAGAEITAVDNPWLVPVDRAAPTVSLLEAVALALLGGLILNLMPCVLPVLAIKVFGIAERAHHDRGDVLRQGAAYTAGISLTMAALAGVVIALRGAGTAVGWGFQFQEPLYAAAIATLLLGFALNLFGVFEIGAPRLGDLANAQPSTGVRASFFEGLLAVLLATPCTAPFLGTAVGFAFASPAPVILAVFLAIGLGLAAPFALVSLVPGWARWIPKSGPWMTTLRSGLGFALLATLVWLLWIVGRGTGSDGMALLLGFLVLVAIGVWIVGLRQRASADGRAPVAGALCAGLAVAALAVLPLEPVTRPAEAALAPTAIDAARFDPEAVADELAAGRPVFVIFTADWCLTCKLNEQTVLRDARVTDELERRGVATFEADWTLRDEIIRQELARFGRAGVPLYLLYDPTRPDEPALLPELLTVDVVLDALAAVAGAAEPG